MSIKDIPDELVCLAYHRASQNKENLPQNCCVDRYSFPCNLLMSWIGQPEKVCYRACERAEEHGLIECGVSLRTGWLTEKGKILLRDFLEERQQFKALKFAIDYCIKTDTIKKLAEELNVPIVTAVQSKETMTDTFEKLYKIPKGKTKRLGFASLDPMEKAIKIKKHFLK